MAEIVPRDVFESTRDQMRWLMQRMEEPIWWPSLRMPFSLDEGTLDLDVYADPKTNEVVVKASLPGFKKENISVQIEDGVVSIKAEQEEEKEEKGQRYYRRERRFGSVNRRIALPGAVDEAAAKAELKDGVFTVRVPQAKEAQAKQVQINIA